MKKLLLLALLWSSVVARSATGDILSASIETNGIAIRLVLENMATNQSWTLSSTYTTNGHWANVPTANTPYVTFNSPGYKGAGTEWSWEEKHYLTQPVRFPQPDDAFKDTSIVDGTNVAIRVYLDSHVLQSDTNFVLNVPQGFYGAMTSNQVVNVTNGSLQPAVQPIGNWSYLPPYILITSNVFDCHLQSYHWSGERNPVEGVEVRAKDTNGTTVTVTRTNLAFNTKWNLASIKYPEYIVPITMTNLAHGPIRFDFTTWPRRGRAPITTTNDTNVLPTEKWAAHTNFYAPNWIPIHAYVSLSGSDTTGAGATNAATAALTPFRTISKAAAAIPALNNTHNGFSSTEGGIIHIASGEAFTYPGNSQTYGNVGRHWLNIVTDSGQQGELSGFGGGAGPRVTRFNNMKMNTTSAGNMTSQIHWYDNCWFAQTNNSTYTGAGGAFYFTDNGISGYNTGGINPSSGAAGPIPLFRGNSITNYAGPIRSTLYIANRSVGTNNRGGSFIRPVGNTIASTSEQWPNNWIVSFNEIYQANVSLNGGNFIISAHSNNNVCTNGGAIVGNMVEQVFGTVGGCVLIAADGTGANVTNIVVAHNTFKGKNNMLYNDTATDAWWQVLCGVFNNYFTDLNIKADQFGTTSGRGGRIGNWANMNGVNWRNNHFGEQNKSPDSVGTPGLLPEFAGIYAISRGTFYNRGEEKPWDEQSHNGDGITIYPGLGNYRVRPNSLLQGIMPTVGYLTHSLQDGRGLGRNAPVGAYGGSLHLNAGYLGF